MTPSKFDRIKAAFIEDLIEAPHPLMNMPAPVHEIEMELKAEAETLSESNLSLGMLIDTAKKAPTLGTYLRIKAHRCNRITYRAAVFEQGQISRDYWSRLLNDEVKASKEKLLRVAVLLRLSIEETVEMLDHIGYSLSPTIPRDVVIGYCLREQHYDFVVIEQLLADHHIQSLFNDRRVSQ